MYKSAFAEAPWNEYMKCGKCNVNYSLEEVETQNGYDREENKISWQQLADGYRRCKQCATDLSPETSYPHSGYCGRTSDSLIPFWSAEDVREDLIAAQRGTNPIILVSETDSELAGFSWGYKIPFKKFPFLAKAIDKQSSYIDEIAVSGEKRRQGIGKKLLKEYISRSNQTGFKEIVLRTDIRNDASVGLFEKQGFSNLNIYDPEFENRAYFALQL